MASRITENQRRSVLEMLAEGFGRETTAAKAGVTPGQVSAVAAHVTMGTYEQTDDPVTDLGGNEVSDRVSGLLEEISAENRRAQAETRLKRAETDEQVFWNPDPSNGSRFTSRKVAPRRAQIWLGTDPGLAAAGGL